MTCDSGRRKVFADEAVAMISELARRHGIGDVVVHRHSDPVLVAARGCLKGEQGEERIELVVQLSADLARAERVSVLGAQVAAEPTGDTFRAFDLSEVVAKDTVAYAAEPERDEGCDPGHKDR